jgi:alkylresorcinol/alkylpyrone synthase
MNKVGLLSLATALPPYIVEQSVAKAKAREFSAGARRVRPAVGRFRQCRHRQRHIVAPIDWYEGHHGWKERNRVYLDACDRLFREGRDQG